MPGSVATFLMFTGQAAEAMELYAATIPGSRIVEMERYKAGEPGAEGTVKRGVLDLDGHQVICFDSPPVHQFTFTPSISLFVTFSDLENLDGVFAKLSEGGSVMMPVGNYGFSQRFGWCADRFGVSWQLNLP